MSRFTGWVADAATVSRLVSVGTNQNGTTPGGVGSGMSVELPDSSASGRSPIVFNRPSAKYVNGAAPVLVIFTGMSTGLPAFSVTDLLFGSDAWTLTVSNDNVPVNFCDSSMPVAGLVMFS